jgi:membrane associated rhomboid family serine protease
LSYEDRDWMREGSGPRWGARGLAPIPLIIGITTAAFIAQAAVQNASEAGDTYLQSHLALSFAGVLRGEAWQVVTYALLHGGLGHLFWNMVGLYVFGSILGDLVSRRTFWLLYILGAVGGAAAHLLWAWRGLPGADGTVIGASGAIMAILVAAALRAPRTPIKLFLMPLSIPLWVLGLFYVASDLIAAIVAWSRGRPSGVSVQAHLGGVAVAVAWFAALRWGDRRPGPRRPRREAAEERNVLVSASRASEDSAEEARMDSLLERIHASGIGSLSDEEREFLKRVSARKREKKR